MPTRCAGWVRGSRDRAITIALDHLAAGFVDAMAAEVDRPGTLADQMAAAAVLLLRNIGDDLATRSVGLRRQRVKAAQSTGEGAGVDPARAGEWIVRMLFGFELLPPMGVNLDSPRAVRRFVADFLISGLSGR
ncbi:hypothetical protein ACWDUN_04435 [Mycobacterium sp. NPDC003323]